MIAATAASTHWDAPEMLGAPDRKVAHLPGILCLEDHLMDRVRAPFSWLSHLHMGEFTP